MARTTALVERERKFEAAEDVRLADVPGASMIEDSDVRLTATYWDTVHRRLLHWGHALCHRRASDGSEDRWTLKLAIPSREKKGELRRAEVRVRGSRLYPPAAIRNVVRAVIRRGVLTPIATITTDRHRVGLVGRDAMERIELRDDHVSSIVDFRRGPAFRQIEVESRSPEADALMNKASDALIDAGAIPTEATKLGMVLGAALGPEIILPQTGPGISIRDFVRFAFGSGAQRLVSNDPATRIGADPEAVHQARVATRRLRSDLKTLGPLLDSRAATRIRDELHWLGELLGSVRDADVLIERVDGLGRELHLARDATSSILSELKRDRRRSHGVLVSALASRRYVALVESLVGAAEDPPLADGIDVDKRARPRIRKLVRRSWRRVSRAVKRLEPQPDDAALHEIRKSAKRARYGAELAASGIDEDGDRMANRLADLQGVLGDLQDAAVAEERLASMVRDERISGEAAFVAGRLAWTMGQLRSEARDRWRAAWKAARRKRLRRWLR